MKSWNPLRHGSRLVSRVLHENLSSSDLLLWGSSLPPYSDFLTNCDLVIDITEMFLFMDARKSYLHPLSPLWHFYYEIVVNKTEMSQTCSRWMVPSECLIQESAFWVWFQWHVHKFLSAAQTIYKPSSGQKECMRKGCIFGTKGGFTFLHANPLLDRATVTLRSVQVDGWSNLESYESCPGWDSMVDIVKGDQPFFVRKMQPEPIMYREIFRG